MSTFLPVQKSCGTLILLLYTLQRQKCYVTNFRRCAVLVLVLVLVLVFVCVRVQIFCCVLCEDGGGGGGGGGGGVLKGRGRARGARLLVRLHAIHSSSSSFFARISVMARVLSRLLVIMRCSVDLVVMPHSATS